MPTLLVVVFNARRDTRVQFSERLGIQKQRTILILKTAAVEFTA
jgi:hypothetical protein